MTPRRPTKHDAMSGRKQRTQSGFDLPTKAEMRKVDRWLKGESDTELPKENNIEQRKRKNRARSKACARVVRCHHRHRNDYNAYMRDYMRRKRMKQRAAP